jgi:hypothetical protein
MKYGTLPHEVGTIENGIDEMMFYQYLPIKDRDSFYFSIPSRLDNDFIAELLTVVNNDFINLRGVKEFKENYVYLTVKQLYVTHGKGLNRPGIHSDGFMTEDINYIWSNEMPTIFYSGEFQNVPMDDIKSIEYFEQQKSKCERVVYPTNTILRLNQFNIHETNTIEEFNGLRCFVKVSYSKDKYDLKGNARNDIIAHDWEYRERNETRNIPQKINL